LQSRDHHGFAPSLLSLPVRAEQRGVQALAVARRVPLPVLLADRGGLREVVLAGDGWLGRSGRGRGRAGVRSFDVGRGA
jgi:hypothetical protein